jgi:outer membrane protein assembly factor BamD (BamD/ComL family)
MKYVIATLSFLCALTTFSSCSTKQSAINQLDNFSMELKENSANYSADDWKDAVTKFQKIRTKISRHNYTADEHRQIGLLEGKCARYMVNGAKDELTNGLFGIGNEIQGIIDGIKNNDEHNE